MGFNVKKDEDEAQVNELVDVIDRLMMGGQGHLTIDTACCQPTEEDAVDRDED